MHIKKRPNPNNEVYWNRKIHEVGLSKYLSFIKGENHHNYLCYMNIFAASWHGIEQ